MLFNFCLYNGHFEDHLMIHELLEQQENTKHSLNYTELAVLFTNIWLLSIRCNLDKKLGNSKMVKTYKLLWG